MAERHAVRRVQHPLVRREITVLEAEWVAPGMRRLTFGAESLKEFESSAFDDHIKLFFTPDCNRDFTPRRFDRQLGRLTLDFAVHPGGVASDWATAAGPGDALLIGGPRGSTVVAEDFDWYWMIGDVTALPAIGRRLEEAAEGTPIRTFVCLDRREQRQEISTRAAWQAHWCLASELRQTLRDQPLPAGEGMIWIAGENELVRDLRQHLIEERGHPAEWIWASSYWRRNEAPDP